MGNLHEAESKFQYNKYLDPYSKGGSNYSGPFIHPSIENFEEEMIKPYEHKTLIENNLQKMVQFKDRDCLGYRKKLDGDEIYEDKYTFYTYAQIHKMVINFAKNIHQRPELIVNDTYNNKNFKLIGIFAKNCTEWVVTDMGCQLDKITTVTLYSTLGDEAFKYICEQTQISTICVSPDLIEMLVNCKKKYGIPTLQNIILYEMSHKADQSDIQSLIDAGFHVISFDKLIKENTEVSESMLEISKPDTVMTICYTSGTTGDPKGVMIIQRNMISMLETCIKSAGPPADEKRAHISFLPLAHIMERFVISGFMSFAGRIGFISGSVRTTLMKDIELLKPSMLFVVPRVMQTIRTKLFDMFNTLPWFKRNLIFKALEIKKNNFNKYGVITHAFFDKIVFGELKRKFGGSLDCILCASAPLPKDLADEFKMLLSVPIIEGWGMTELSGAPFASHFTDFTNNTSGGVIYSAMMKILDVPELNYTKNSIYEGEKCPSGEICIKGPIVCQGYYKNPTETEKAFDSDGYLHTGDVGRIIPHFNNGIRIIDRVKEIFKLSQGEYIIPNKLENVYSKSKYINQMFIYGNSTKNNIIAIITPNKKSCCEFLNIPKGDPIDPIFTSHELKEEIIVDLENLAKQVNFNSLEKVKFFIYSDEEFSVDNDCMTPTLKLVRKKIEEKYKAKIDALYETCIHQN